MKNTYKKMLSFIGATSFAITLFAQSLNTTYKAENGNILELSGKRCISGVYPNLCTYAHARVNGQYKFGNECGIGALAVWNGKLYMINYAAHEPKGSEHKLYIIDKDKNMSIYPFSVGGTPAARMIHKESNQLLIGHYLIDKNGNIRTIPISTMPGRITAIARHLTDPKHMVYYYDMEGMLYEANVYTLKVTKLFNNPLPGWHGKGAYTSQGKLILANNGEHKGESSKEWKVPADKQNGPENRGVLSEFDGKNFKVVERRQFTDVTTKNGINAVPNEQSPLWTIGWDKRALRLKVMESGKWYTYLLPKACYNNDPSHGWFTEWPRIREIGNNEMMMDMHGMFYNFPSTFSVENSAGISPISSHLRYIPDFCSWNGQIVIATDETSIQGNPLAGQPQSNLWFGTKKDLYQWGPATGYGSIYLEDAVKKGEISNPYLFSGFDNRIAHIINSGKNSIEFEFQLDVKGDGKWINYKNISLAKGQYIDYIFPKTLKAQWIRVANKKDGICSVIFHYTTDKFINPKTYASEFEALTDIDSKETVLGGKMFSNRINYNLSCFSTISKNGKILGNTPYEFNKFDFDFTKGITDTLANRALETKVAYSKTEKFTIDKIDKSNLKELISIDDASVVLHTKNGDLRLPKGNKEFDNQKGNRIAREVESEREIANIHGTFYELPLDQVGKEPFFEKMRPISSHNKQIDDFNSWNGLLVMTGVRQSAQPSNRVYKSKNNDAALWMGSIDDLWKLGKPVGIGGPWKNTQVKANEFADPYLMTGYDKKTLVLKSDKDVTVSLYLTVAQYLNSKVLYKEFKIKADKPFTYVFPKGFSAHWAHLKVNKDCVMNAKFIYE